MAVLPAPLCYRNLQQLKNQALLTASGNYEAEVLLDQAAKEELKHELLNRRPLQPPTPDLTKEMMPLSWAGVQERVSTWVSKWTQPRLWLEEECQSHINHLELLGAALAVQTYTNDETVSHVHLRIDSGVLHQPHGWDQVTHALTHGLPTVGVVPENVGDTRSRVPPWVTQCDSR